jgi:hypothetical protein
MSPAELRNTAARYREMAKHFSDLRTVDALKELADRYDAMAVDVEGQEAGQGRCR